MNWLSNYVRPRIKRLIGEGGTSVSQENRWQKCPDCASMSYVKDLKLRFYVCKDCSHHFRIPISSRLEMLYDNGKYDVISVAEIKDDPLKFKDSIRYTDRLKKARHQTSQRDSVQVVSGTIDDQSCVTVIFDFGFMGGSLGSAAGQAFVTAAETAVKQRSALLAITASGGARMQEGVVSLMQLPRSVIAIHRVQEAKLPYIVLLTNPTMGGVTASFAMLGDIHLAEPKAVIGFAGRRVSSTTSRIDLPEDFQTAEFLLSKGFIDQIVMRKKQKHTIGSIIRILTKQEMRNHSISA